MIQATDTLELLVCSGMEMYPIVAERVRKLHDAGLEWIIEQRGDGK